MYVNVHERKSVLTPNTADASTYSIQKFSKSLLETCDVLQMALENTKSPEKDAELKTLHDGVAMTRRGLLKVLERNGITEFNPLGEDYDANRHTALYMVPMPDKKPNTVFSVEKSGYGYADLDT
jgi:molecular chaperone GrpE